ncbi:hypothetical protein PTUN_a0240 [Pseudoalteromonas tunicata]|nr:hypothetical protein PTUN_a0240 [Pseudoalteromonas tunicata]
MIVSPFLLIGFNVTNWLFHYFELLIKRLNKVAKRLLLLNQ